MSTTVEDTALAVIEKTPSTELFKPGFLDPIIDRIRTEALAEASALDISTEKGRKAIASLAYKVAQSKTFLEKQRKELVSDEKRRLAAIDKEGSRVWDELEKLQHEVRKPLTDWENAEKERVARHEAALAGIAESPMYGARETSQEIEERLRYLESAYDIRDWQEFSSRAKLVIDSEIARTKDILARVQAREHEQAELARLRAEEARRQQEERERRIAEEAAEKARLAAEEAARKEREAIERRAREEREELERAAKAAEEKARREREDAEKKRLAEEEAKRQELIRQQREAEDRERKAQQEKADAEARAKKAEADRIAAVQRAEREKQEAIEAERRRVEAERLREEKERIARENDRKHKAAINLAAMAAIAQYADLTDEQAKEVIAAIAKKLIPSVTIKY